MDGKNLIRCVVGAMVLLLVGSAAVWAVQGKADAAKEKSKTAVKAKKVADDEEVPLPDKEKDDKGGTFESGDVLPDLAERYAEMAQVCKMDEEQQKKLLEIQEQRDKAMEAFRKSADRKMQAAEKNLDRARTDKQRDKVREQLNEIDRQAEAYRGRLEMKYEMKAFAVMTAEQRATWNAHELWVKVQPSFVFDESSLDLTDEQVEQAKKVCEELAHRAGGKGPIAENDKAVQTARTQIAKKVLTKEQKKAFIRLERRRQREAEEKQIKELKDRHSH